MPGLKENLAALLMNRIDDGLPCIRVLLCHHQRRVGPLGAVIVDKCALGDYQSRPVAGSICVVLNGRLSRLVLVDAAVPGHGAHANSVPQLGQVAQYHGFQETRHNVNVCCEGVVCAVVSLVFDGV